MYAPNGQIQTLTHNYKLPTSRKSKPKMPIKDFRIATWRLKRTTRHLIDSMMMMMMMMVVAVAVIITTTMTSTKSYKICSYIWRDMDIRDSDHGDSLYRRYSILLKMLPGVQIQGVSRLVDIIAGGDFIGLCDQKSSHKHVSNFGWLRSYDRLKLRTESNDY